MSRKYDTIARKRENVPHQLYTPTPTPSLPEYHSYILYLSLRCPIATLTLTTIRRVQKIETAAWQHKIPRNACHRLPHRGRHRLRHEERAARFFPVFWRRDGRHCGTIYRRPAATLPTILILPLIPRLPSYLLRFLGILLRLVPLVSLSGLRVGSLWYLCGPCVRMPRDFLR